MVNKYKELVDSNDGSINHVYEDGSEFRLVHRKDHDTIYLSSHTGCNLSCRFCHLTQTGQTSAQHLSHYDMLWRAERLLLDERRTAKTINFAFMARGDALANTSVNDHFVKELLSSVDGDCHARINISTIFPTTVIKPHMEVDEFLLQRFGCFQPTIYWSLYSVDPEQRKIWLPNAEDPHKVVRGLVRWQKRTHQEVTIHFAVIDGFNNRKGMDEPLGAAILYPKDVFDIANFLKDSGLSYRTNLVRYNPFDASCSTEAPEEDYQDYAKWLARAKVVQRVGFDVKASCGMFVAPEVDE